MDDTSHRARTFVDRGGTFTDVVTVGEDGGLTVRKVPSDRAVVGDLARGPLTFGTTVATNALLERKGVRTLLVVSRGFADLPWIGDQARPALFDLEARWPEPLCDRVLEVDGRIDAAGRELEPLVLPEALAERLGGAGIEAAAVVLLHGHRNPAHELAVGEALDGVVPFVTLGHRVSPEVGYLGRIETTLVDAAITPILRRALDRDAISDAALAMRSDGSLCPAPRLRAPDAVLSGPSGGVLAVAAVAEQAGFGHAVGLDMGGTSTDVCRVDVGRIPRREGEVRVAGVRIRRPMFEVETIAAGGGSILANDGLRLTVGPESAGADPGPQCYGRGGPPTLTDAALARGLVDPAAFDPPLREDAVELPGDADEFLDIAREAMAQAVRQLATSRGVDLRDHALVSYGGAAGQHAAEVARRLGIRTVLVHPAASVLCAWGQALAHREESDVRPLWRSLPEAWPDALEALDALSAGLPALGREIRSVELRHRGTDHSIEVFLSDGGEELDAVLEAFAAEHRRRYGFDRPGQDIELVNARVRVRAPLEPLPELDDDPWGLDEGVVVGPRLLTTATTAIHVPAGWRAQREGGLLWLEEVDPKPPPMPEARTPYAVELWGNRFQAIAEEAGETLRRLARSVNIRERRDFSCALFDAGGRLVANAPHIPVHLGAMGETVRDLMSQHPDPAPGQAWLSNDPAAGGSHLPDLTVVTPVEVEGHRWFVACRGHHVDVGGLTPGSMPPHSTRLDEEGFVVRNLPLLQGGRLRDVREALVGCREPDTVLADLEAQVAANAHAARLLAGMGPPGLVDAWMRHLHDVADEAVGEVLDRLRPGEAADRIGGVPLRMALAVRDGVLHVDLEGTGGPHAGNLNAPHAVVRAAVLYGLRVLVGRPIPLNEGALRRVRIHRPEPSIVAPPPEAAVAGGNVETSQRLVDLFFRAADARAGSQGTMNNLTLGARGGEAWSLYETLGGGLGASAAGPGADGVQVHMTNTRATDAEVLEERLPLRLRAFRHRPDGDGAGQHRGGRGLVRELEVIRPARAALLATRRDEGAAGLHGGGSGAPGRDSVRRSGRWEPWDGRAVDLEPGDRVRVETPGGGGWGRQS